MKSLKAKFRKTDSNEWSKNDERLLSAVEHGETEKVTALLTKKGACGTKLDSEGKTALHVAATRGQTECLAVILAHGADVSAVDASGSSALHLAAKNNQLECAKKLIQSKCAVDALDSCGRTALHHAAASGNAGLVQLLCEHKCPVNLKDADGLPPLLLSARLVHAEVCCCLLDWGADVNACDKHGRTAIMLASESGCVAAVEALLQSGARLDTVDSLGHDVLHYAKLSGNGDVHAAINAALHHLQSDSDKNATRTTQHDPMAKQNEERSTTPKKRKAPPPPISPEQLAGVVSPPYLTPTETPVSSKSDLSKRFNYKEEELRSVALKEDIEKLQEEKSLLLETIEDLKQQIAKHSEPKTAHCGNADSTLVASLQAKVASLSLEKQQLAQIIKKRPTPQGEEDRQLSRPNSIDSNASYHSTHADFDHSSDGHSQVADVQELSELSILDVSGTSLRHEEQDGGSRAGSGEEVLLLRNALQNMQAKLQESRMENCSLQAQLKPSSCADEAGSQGVSESVTELKAKLADMQRKYKEVLEEVRTLKVEGRGHASAGEDPVIQKFQYLKGCLEQEIKDLKVKLAKSQEEKMRDAGLIKDLEARLKSNRMTEDERQELKKSYNVLVENVSQEKALLIEKYKEAQEEIKILQEALRGTVPVDAAAKDFEEMKAELGEVIEGLQRRLLELSKSYSEAKSELSAARTQLQAKAAEAKERPDAAGPTKEQHEQKIQELALKMKDVQSTLKDTEVKYQAALREISLLKQEAKVQAEASVGIGDHTQVVASLGNAMKNLEAEAKDLKLQLCQKTSQLDALQSQLAALKDTPNDSVSRLEHEQVKETLEREVKQLTHLLQDALRKQDEMALEVTAAWQEVKDGRNEKQTLQKLAVSREQESNVLNTKYREAQDVIMQLKKQVENHVGSERDKNKKIDDLSKEVGKLKDALNSLSQLSYTTNSPKRQQNQQVEALQQQIKQLQYQQAESKKQHHETISVYRMHLLYAVQGQMDEDVQKALKQILMMCKMPTEAK